MYWHQSSKNRVPVLGLDVTFLYLKRKTLYFTRFSWKFRTWHLYTKSITLCVSWLILYKNLDTSQEASQFALRFYIGKSRHFGLRNFSLNFWNWRRSGDMFIRKKQSTLRYIFILKKNALWIKFFYKKPDTFYYIFISKKKSLCVTFIYISFTVDFWNWRRSGDMFRQKKTHTLRYVFLTKSLTLCVSFYILKQCTLRYVYKYIIYRIVQTPKYKRTYDSTDQIEKWIPALYWELVLFLQ